MSCILCLKNLKNYFYIAEKFEITKYQYLNCCSRGRLNDPPRVAPGGTGTPEHHLIKQNFKCTCRPCRMEMFKTGRNEEVHGQDCCLAATNHAAEIDEVHVEFIGIHGATCIHVAYDGIWYASKPQPVLIAHGSSWISSIFGSPAEVVGSCSAVIEFHPTAQNLRHRE